MPSRSEFVVSALAALVLPSGTATPFSGIAAASPSATDGETIFKRAKDVWRAREDLPYLAYAMRERYVWRGRPHETWWHAWFRLSDRNVALQRMIVPSEEDERLKGSAISIHMRFHQHNGPASLNLDTNPNADAFAVLDPLIEPVGSFGMLRPLTAQLVEGDAPGSGVGALPTPAAAVPAPSPASAFGAPVEPLHELAHVEAVARDYRITNLGIETLRDGESYHLKLEPIRNPYRYRLRDLWVATSDARTLRLVTHGLFVGPPYDTAEWLVTYTQIDGRSYVQEVTTPQALRFGPDHGVTDFAFDFVDYSFPTAVPDSIFERLLSPRG